MRYLEKKYQRVDAKVIHPLERNLLPSFRIFNPLPVALSSAPIPDILCPTFASVTVRQTERAPVMLAQKKRHGGDQLLKCMRGHAISHKPAQATHRVRLRPHVARSQHAA